MLDLNMLKAMPPGTVFASGTAKDTPDGLYIFGDGRDLLWVAKCGKIHDWTIYYLPMPTDIQDVIDWGDKVMFKNHIQKLVPCDEQAFDMYRF